MTKTGSKNLYKEQIEPHSRQVFAYKPVRQYPFFGSDSHLFKIIMKVAIFVLLALVAVVASSPVDKKDTKNQAFGKCANICQDDSNKPLCATDGGKLMLSFMNECALKKYNCEQNKILTKKSDKECPGSTGIRLS